MTSSNVSTTIVAPSCTTVAVPTTRPSDPSAANATTANGAARPTATIIPHPSSSGISISNGATQQAVSVAFMGLVAAGVAFVL